jgi:hypothetical protein
MCDRVLAATPDCRLKYVANVAASPRSSELAFICYFLKRLILDRFTFPTALRFSVNRPYGAFNNKREGRPQGKALSLALSLN